MQEFILPNLNGIATADLVEQIGNGNFRASYINWARTVSLLREHAPGWQPELVASQSGDILHRAPVGAYLMIRFRNGDAVTAPVPQAVMDNRNASIPFDRINSRDVTDTHRRGVCMAAAFTFGLAYELWAKIPLESGYSSEDDDADAQTNEIVAKPRPDIDSIKKALTEASDMRILRGHFQAAWQMLEPGPDRDGVKDAYDQRKSELESIAK